MLHEWRRDDAGFARELEEAYEKGTDRFVDALMNRALLPDHDALAIFLLKQRDPRRFNQKMVEVRVSGDPDNPIGVQHEHRASAMIYPLAELMRSEPVPMIEATPKAIIEPANGVGEKPAEEKTAEEKPEGWQTLVIKRRRA